MNAPQNHDFRQMTTDSVGKDLLQALLLEIKLLPDAWQKLSQKKQDDVIDRLRNRIETNVKMAVHTLAASGRTVVSGALEQITIKDGVKAVVKFGSAAANLTDLYEASGKAVLVIVANPDDHTGGMDEIAGEPDQRAMDLGHEYHDNDGGGMEEAQSNVIDGEVLALPSEATSTEEELDAQFDAGWDAAEAGKPESECPVMKGDLCIAWVKGWKGWHEQNENPNGNQPIPELE